MYDGSAKRAPLSLALVSQTEPPVSDEPEVTCPRDRVPTVFAAELLGRDGQLIIRYRDRDYLLAIHGGVLSLYRTWRVID